MAGLVMKMRVGKTATGKETKMRCLRNLCIFGVLLLSILLAQLLPSRVAIAKDTDWKKVVRAVEKLRDDFKRRAKELHWRCCLGTAFNEYMVSEHKCAILGRMLEKTKYIQHLEVAQPGPDASADDFALAAHSLGNWLINFKNLQSLSRQEKIKIWNLDCAGKLEIAPSEAIVEDGARPTFYTIENEGDVLRILGDVEKGFYANLTKALDDNQGVKYVALGSGGGFVSEALLAGFEIRKRGLETTVWNNCYSACPLVFMGGVKRTVWSPYPDLGFHQISDENGALSANSSVYSLVQKYIKSMGVEPAGVLSLMLSAKPSEMRKANFEELCNLRIATWVQRNCWVD